MADDWLASVEAEFAATLAAPTLASTESGRSSPALITALSGGADSTALCLLAARYAARHHLDHRAVIIDHGLRDGSAAEAARVAARMTALDIEVEIIRINAAPSGGGIQEWARRVRYDALLAAARPTKAVLLLGHHAGDQVETIAMRLLRGSGLAGLAGMGGHSQFADIHILRPMLAWGADRPVALCKALDCGFETDPSNADRRFERVRMRQMLAACQDNAAGTAPLASLASLPDQLSRLAGLASRLCVGVDRALADFYPALTPAGFTRIDPLHLAPLSPGLWNRVLRRVIRQIAAPDHPPSSASMAQLRERLSARQAATLGGCKFTPASADYLVTREIGRDPCSVAVAADESLCFDRLWRITTPVAGTLHLWGALDAEPRINDDPEPAVLLDIRQNIPHPARIAIPVLDTLDGKRLYPQLEGMAYPSSLLPEGEEPFTASFLGADVMETHHMPDRI